MTVWRDQTLCWWEAPLNPALTYKIEVLPNRLYRFRGLLYFFVGYHKFLRHSLWNASERRRIYCILSGHSVLDRTLICPLLGSGRQIRVPSLHKHSASFHYVASQASPQASGGGSEGEREGRAAFGGIMNYGRFCGSCWRLHCRADSAGIGIA